MTPHAGALALISSLAPEAAANLQALAALSTCSYDPAYGFPDAVLADPAAAEYGQCSQRFSVLAQEWLFLALANHGNGFIWKHFYLDDGVSAAHAEMYPPVFTDVPYDFWSFTWIERVYDAGLTGGCALTPLRYCPTQPVTRAQMAVFLERGIHGNSYQPPDAPPTFSDTVGHWAEDWIEALRIDGVTGGCGDGNFCPQKTTTRAEMAVFLLRAKYGPTYAPPAASGTLFTDVPSTHWAAAWIEQLAAESITGGCGAGKYCPDSSVTRAQMAVFLVKAFGLP